jgi:mono/diheme cytochrome c family protein
VAGLRPILALTLAVAPLAATSPEDAATFKAEIRPLLLNYCGDCHGPSKQVALLGLKDLSQLQAHRGELRSAVVQLRNRTMPPAKDDQPSEEERRLLADWIERVLRVSAKEMGPYAGAVTARRLNRLEYDNTIRDLLGLKFKFSQTFPTDGGGGEGFDNNGETLYLPVILMERYLDAAEAILDEAILVPETRRSFKPADLEKGSTAQLRPGAEASVFFPVTMTAPHTVTVTARANPGKPARLELKVDGIAAQRFTVSAQPTQIQLRLFRGSHRLTLACEEGEAELTEIQLADNPRKITPERQEAHRRLLGDVSTASLAAKSPAERRATAANLLQKFARQAYRAPVGPADIEKNLTLFDRSAARGENFETSMKLAFKAILVSPRFLFRLEKDHVEPGIRPVSDHELACRLSYFLWNSTPDAELTRLADDGRLQDPATLKAQLKRMLADRRSASFLQTFTEQWLGTKAVGDTVPASPEAKDSKFVYSKEIGDDLRAEGLALMDHLIKEDRSLLELISADYTYLNGRLAAYYGIPGVQGDEFRRVAITDGRRGGVLGLGAVQMLTSPGTRTSPVLRGSWVLGTLLGTPVPAPPPNVPSLDAAGGQKKGKLSLREKLALHRADATCASCHNVIDPIGFSLDHYDRLGRWRDVDEKGQPIDASGKTAEGKAFDGIAGFKNLILDRKRDFARQVTAKMLGYALGRSLADRDDGTIEAIVDKLEASGYRSQVLLEEIVLSIPFRNRNEVGDRPAPKPAKKEKGEK